MKHAKNVGTKSGSVLNITLQIYPISIGILPISKLGLMQGKSRIARGLLG
jgi:hypothetical protein